MIFVYDTETSGLTLSHLPADHPAQPRLVQLGALLLTEEGTEVSSVSLIVRPEGWSIPDEASLVHGITTGFAEAAGVSVVTALSAFAQLRANARLQVAYNLDFDRIVMAAAFARASRKPKVEPEELCAMRAAGPIVNLPPTEKMKAAGFDRWKPPSLAEAYRFLFGRELPGPAHSALADARAAAEVYFELKKRGAA